MRTYRYNIIGVLLAITLQTGAQTTNIGELTISANTQMSILDAYNNSITGSTMNDGELFLYSNFNNDGLYSYFDAANEGLTRFQGTAVQQITGSSNSEFYNVLFSNPSAQPAFELIGDINIVNEADFDIGVVNNDAHGGSITFENLGYSIHTSDDSHVDGLVIKNGDTDFEYPIGDQDHYRMAAISAPDAISDVISAQYILENSNTQYPHDLAAGVIALIDNTEYWILNNEQGASNVVLTLSWNTDTTPSEIISGNLSAIHIVRWDADQGFWVDEGGIVDEVNQRVTTISEVSGYGIFTLARVKEELVLPGDIVIYNGITPNGDGDNDFFFIDGIERYPDNSVTIFNRWGVKVYETRGYNNTDRVFDGTSDGRITFSQDDRLPTGTYFYILTYDGGGGAVKKAGYLYINKDDN